MMKIDPPINTRPMTNVEPLTEIGDESVPPSKENKLRGISFCFSGWSSGINREYESIPANSNAYSVNIPITAKISTFPNIDFEKNGLAKSCPSSPAPSNYCWCCYYDYDYYWKYNKCTRLRSSYL